MSHCSFSLYLLSIVRKMGSSITMRWFCKVHKAVILKRKESSFCTISVNMNWKNPLVTSILCLPPSAMVFYLLSRNCFPMRNEFDVWFLAPLIKDSIRLVWPVLLLKYKYISLLRALNQCFSWVWFSSVKNGPKCQLHIEECYFKFTFKKCKKMTIVD